MVHDIQEYRGEESKNYTVLLSRQDILTHTWVVRNRDQSLSLGTRVSRGTQWAPSLAHFSLVWGRFK